MEIDPETSNCPTFEETSAPDRPSRSPDLRLRDRDRDRRRDFRDRERRRDFGDRDLRPLEAARFLVSFSGLFSVLKIQPGSKGETHWFEARICFWFECKTLFE